MNPEQQYQNGQPTVVTNGQSQHHSNSPQQPQPTDTFAPSQAGEYATPFHDHMSEHASANTNPYEFIFAEKHQPKQSGLLGGSASKKIMVIVGGVLILAAIVALVVTLLTPKDTSFEKLTSLLQEQQEIVRVADLADASAKSIDLKNLAVNVSLSVGTNKISMQKYLSDRNIKITDVVLAAKQDTKTDTLFTSATSSNTFDHTAAQTIQSLLVTYRSNLNTAYQGVKGTNARKELISSYQTAEILITEANKVVGQ